MLRALPEGRLTLTSLRFPIPAREAVFARRSISAGSSVMFGSVKLARTSPSGKRDTPRLRGSRSRPLRLSVINARCVSLIESEVGGRFGAVREFKKPDKRGICRIFVNCKSRDEEDYGTDGTDGIDGGLPSLFPFIPFIPSAP